MVEKLKYKIQNITKHDFHSVKLINLFVGIFFLLTPFVGQAQPWNQLVSGTTENLNSIHFINDTVGFVAGNSGVVLKTTDGGIAWTDIYTVNNDTFYSIHAIDEDTIYIGGSTGLYKTIDGGGNWNPLIISSGVITDINFITPQRGYIYKQGIFLCTDFNTGGTYNYPGGYHWETNDFGSSWSGLGIQMGGHAGIQFTSDSVGYILGDKIFGPGPDCAYGAEGVINKTIDGATNWIATVPIPYFEGPPDFHFVNDSIGYFGPRAKTFDGGITVVPTYTNLPGVGLESDIKFVNEHEGYLTKGNEILKTTSDAFVWASDYSGSIPLSELYVIDTTVAYCIGDSGVIVKKMLNPVTSPDTIYSISADPMNVNFGNVLIGTMGTSFFKINNTGTELLQISLSAPLNFEINIAGTASYGQAISSFNLGAQRDTIINVRFIPTAAQQYIDSINIVSNATNSPSLNVNTFGGGVVGLTGTINTDTLLCVDTVWVGSNIVIDSNVTVTICPGTVMAFMGYYKIDVNGKLIAISNSIDSIVFTPLNKIVGWEGINFNNNSINDTSIFEYCKFEYGESGNNALLSIYSYPNVLISRCSFINNGGELQILFNDGYLSVEESNFTNNSSNPITIDGEADGQVLIRKNTFYDNGTLFGVAPSPIIVVSNYSKVAIESNFIYNHPTAGIAVLFSYGDVSIINNVIFNNNKGWYNTGGIHIHTTNNVKVLNNTFVNNEHPTLSVINSDNCIIKNNIIYGALGTSVNWNNSTSELEHNDIQGGYSGIGNIDVAPQFVNPTMQSGILSNIQGFDWNLIPHSQCINKGTSDTTGLGIGSLDIANNNRIFGDTIDMGAFESRTISPSPYQGKRCAGDSLFLYTTLLDTSAISIQWNLDGLPLIGENNDSLYVNPISSTDEGIYSCDVYYSNDTVLGNYSTVYMDTVQPVIISQTTSIGTILLGDSIYLYVNADYEESFQWYQNGNAIPGATDSNYIIYSATANDTGNYFCEITNGCGNIISQSVNVNIVGVGPFMAKDKINVYPNPTTKQLTIVSDQLTINDITIINITGKIIRSIQNTSERIIINVAELPSGVYFIKLHTDEEIITKKFIKQ